MNITRVTEKFMASLLSSMTGGIVTIDGEVIGSVSGSGSSSGSGATAGSPGRAAKNSGSSSATKSPPTIRAKGK